MKGNLLEKQVLPIHKHDYAVFIFFGISLSEFRIDQQNNNRKYIYFSNRNVRIQSFPVHFYLNFHINSS